MPHQDRLNIAVFIDFDNIEIGVKSTLNQQFDIGAILDAIKERGEVVTKIAYADWTRAGEYSRTLTQHAIRLVQRNLTPGGDKNGADINLALDALEMAFTHQHINAYVIVGGDSDFLSLVEKLKQYDKKVFVVGGRAFTSVILQRNCHEFIAYENLAGVRKPSVKGGRTPSPPASSPVAQAFPIVRRALKILADREVSPQTGLLKSTLLQLDSTFSERNYGASSFLDFVEKLSQSGFVQLKHAGRSVMVELNEGFDETADMKGRSVVPVSAGVDDGDVQPTQSEVVPFRPLQDKPAQEPPVTATEPGAYGVKLVGQLLASATNARWPMYVRNVKQILRAADPTFDERRYGYGGLIDLLRACQREGLVRLERDRRGGLRVFQGPALQRAAAPQFEPAELIQPEPVEVQMQEPAGPAEPVIEEIIEIEPIPVDTTAELLGRAKPKRAASGHSRGARASTTRGTRKTAAKKPATRRSTRAKKPTTAEAADDTGNT